MSFSATFASKSLAENNRGRTGHVIVFRDGTPELAPRTNSRSRNLKTSDWRAVHWNETKADADARAADEAKGMHGRPAVMNTAQKVGHALWLVPVGLVALGKGLIVLVKSRCDAHSTVT